MKKTATTLAELYHFANSNGKHEAQKITCEKVGKTSNGKAIWKEIGDRAEYVFTNGYFVDLDDFIDETACDCYYNN